MTEGKWLMKIKNIWVMVVVTGVICAVGFPYVANYLCRPHGLLSLEQAEREMRFISSAIIAYKSNHNRKTPRSYSEFIQCIHEQPGDAELKSKIDVNEYQLHTSYDSQDKILVSRYLPYHHGKTLLWIDRNGKVFRSRVWLWPTWAYVNEE